MEHISFKISGHKIDVGSSPRLIIDLESQDHILENHGETTAYRAQIHLSPDLLRGERSQVLQSAINYYYWQACQFTEDQTAAQAYRKRIMAKRKENGKI